MAKESSELWVVASVAIVAIVGIVIMVTSSGGPTVVSSEYLDAESDLLAELSEDEEAMAGQAFKGLKINKRSRSSTIGKSCKKSTVYSCENDVSTRTRTNKRCQTVTTTTDCEFGCDDDGERCNPGCSRSRTCSDGVVTETAEDCSTSTSTCEYGCSGNQCACAPSIVGSCVNATQARNIQTYSNCEKDTRFSSCPFSRPCTVHQNGTAGCA